MVFLLARAMHKPKDIGICAQEGANRWFGFTLFEARLTMTKHIKHSCPRCREPMHIILGEPDENLSARAVNGRCVTCSYCLAWIVFQGNRCSAVHDGTVISILQSRRGLT